MLVSNYRHDRWVVAGFLNAVQVKLDQSLPGLNQVAFLAENLPQIKLASEGATYLAWLDLSSITNDSAEFSRQLREKTGLIVNPGSVYGGNGASFIWLNLAYPRVQIKDALQRLQDFLTEE